MKKCPCWAIAGYVVFFIYGLICFVLSLTGQLTFALSGFGVDREGRLYVGVDGSIQVWQDGERIREIARRYTRRGYVFTIPDGEHILIDTADHEWTTLTLEGQECGSEATDKRLRDEIREKYTPYIGPDGSVYTTHESLLGYYITREDPDGTQIIHQMALWQAVLRLLFVPVFILFALSFRRVRPAEWRWMGLPDPFRKGKRGRKTLGRS